MLLFLQTLPKDSSLTSPLFGHLHQDTLHLSSVSQPSLLPSPFRYTHFMMRHQADCLIEEIVT